MNLREFVDIKSDMIIYLWKRNGWMLNPKSYLIDYSNVVIKEPIFLLGNQGDGLTLLSRMLRRNPQVLSPTGNSDYWAGADEMSNVYELILGAELSGMRFTASRHEKLTPPRSWSYACDEMFKKYRNTEKDVNKHLERKFKHAIGIAISRYGSDIKEPRFVDKSQVYTVKLSFVNKLLEGCNPYYVYITRNPYATIYRAALGRAGDMRRYSKFLSLDERFGICLEHWYNSARSIEEDRRKIRNFMDIKFEELPSFPQTTLKKVCAFVKLKYSDDMIPKADQKMPAGTKFKQEKWYPLREDVNKEYLCEIPKNYINLIYEKCGKYAEQYGYDRPDR